MPITRQAVIVSTDKNSILPYKKPVKFMLMVYDGVVLIKFDKEKYTKAFAESQEDYGVTTLFDDKKGYMVSEYPHMKKDEIFKQIYFKFKETGADLKLRG